MFINFLSVCLFAGVPDVPASVQVYTASSSSLLVSFEEPVNMNGAAATRYKSKLSCLCPTYLDIVICILANCPYLIGTVPILTQERGRKKSDFIMCSYFCKKSACSNVWEIQECSYFKRYSSHLSLFLRFRVGKYEFAAAFLMFNLFLERTRRALLPHHQEPEGW